MKYTLGPVALATCALTACKARTYNSSQVFHRSGEITRSQEEYNWVRLPQNFSADQDSLSKIGINAKPVSGKSWFPFFGNGNGDVSFATETFTKLLSYYKGKGANSIPVPQLVVYQDNQMSAMTALSAHCFSRPVVPDFHADSVTNKKGGVLFSHKGMSATTSTPPQGCVQVSDDVLSRLMAQYNEANYVSCKLTLTNGQVAYSRECTKSSATSAPVFHFQAALPLILVSTEFLKKMSKDGLTFSLAHELAHYYHADGSSLLPELSFLYDEKTYTSDSQPTPLAGDHPLSRLYDEVRQKLGASESVKRYPSQHLHPAAVAKMREFTSNNVCSLGAATCRAALGQFDSLMANLPSIVMYRDYPRYEPENDTESFRRAISKLDSEGLRSLKNVNTSLFLVAKTDDSSRWVNVDEFGKEWEASQTLGEFLERISKLHDTKETQMKNFWTSLANSGLGWYTYEQRADDMGLEAATAVGAQPQCVIQSFISLFPMTVAINGSFDKEKCMQLVESGFSGVEAVPVGNWSDVHHSVCYRAYNLNKEIARHGAGTCRLR